MRDAAPFGLTRRTRRVHHVGEVLGCPLTRQVYFALPTHNSVLIQSDVSIPLAHPLQAPSSNPAVVSNTVIPASLIMYPNVLSDRSDPEGHKLLPLSEFPTIPPSSRRPVHADSDQHLRPNSSLPQVMSQLVCPAVQLPIRQLPAFVTTATASGERSAWASNNSDKHRSRGYSETRPVPLHQLCPLFPRQQWKL